MSNEYVHFNNNTQPAINEDNLNLMQQLIKQDITGAVAGDTLPIGAFMPYAGAVAPTNWLICDGSAVSRTTYQDLFNVIGTTFGPGDGSTTFNLPDMRLRTAVGVDTRDSDFNALGKTGGTKNVTLTIDQIPPHQHTMPSTAQFGHPGNVNFGTSGDWKGGDYLTGSKGGGQPFNIMQPSMATNFIIKAFQTAGVVAEVVNEYSTSTTNVYSADYINNLNTYSTTEKRIGTWIDGKPLYEMAVNFGSLPNNSRTIVATDIPITARVKRITGIAERYANNLHDSRPIENCVSMILYRSETREFFIDTTTDMSAWSAILTAQYTKTTD